MRVLGVGAALLAAVLVQSVLGYLSPGGARLFDPFLLVLVYCALSWGENAGMGAGLAAGWTQDALFGGTVLGFSGLTKVLVGFAIGVASTRFHLGEPPTRVLVLVVASLADALLFSWLASAFSVPLLTPTLLGLLARATLTAGLGLALFEAADRRLRGLERA